MCSSDLFDAMERGFDSQGRSMANMTLPEMEAGWQAVKAGERK